MVPSSQLATAQEGVCPSHWALLVQDWSRHSLAFSILFMDLILMASFFETKNYCRKLVYQNLFEVTGTHQSDSDHEYYFIIKLLFIYLFILFVYYNQVCSLDWSFFRSTKSIMLTHVKLKSIRNNWLREPCFPPPLEKQVFLKPPRCEILLWFTFVF